MKKILIVSEESMTGADFEKLKSAGFDVFIVNDVEKIKTVSDVDLRDYFAAKAMQGILAFEADTTMSATDCARFAYVQADAMLAERAK